MTKLSKLIRDARTAATVQGHQMQRFTHEYNGTGTYSAYSYCDTGCGMGAFVHTCPMPGDKEIGGRAVRVRCPNAGGGQ